MYNLIVRHMKGCIYLIVNKKNLTNKIKPFLYIGSKKDIDGIDTYWGSSKILAEDIKSIGIENFEKTIIEEIQYDNYTELVSKEADYHIAFDVVKSKLFYNKVNANKDFSHFEGGNTVNSIWVNDGKKNKRIQQSELNKFISDGYNVGRLFGDHMKNRIYINNGTNVKSIIESELNLYKSNGWVVGRLNGNVIGTKNITKNGINKKVSIDLVEQFLKDGWTLGQHQNWKTKI